MIFQVGPALLDVCVLSALAREDEYGYQLTQTVQDLFPIAENSIYPVLRRLLEAGYVSSYNRPYQGRNRKYYTITESGRARLAEISDEWGLYKAKVDKLFEGVR